MHFTSINDEANTFVQTDTHEMMLLCVTGLVGEGVLNMGGRRTFEVGDTVGEWKVKRMDKRMKRKKKKQKNKKKTEHKNRYNISVQRLIDICPYYNCCTLE